MTNPFQAEMAYLIRREKEIESRLQELSRDFGVWKERIGLAERAGKPDLALAAEERLDSLRAEATELRDELRLLIEKKRLVRHESRRPTGVEVDRAEALLESFRLSGLVDPDEASLQREFDELRPVHDLDDDGEP
jgi:phage shock protein A